MREKGFLTQTSRIVLLEHHRHQLHFVNQHYSQSSLRRLLLATMDLPQKVLIQMSGAPGSGKSTTSTLLAQPFSAVIIDHDLLRSFFLENEIKFDQAGKLAYRLQWTLAEEMMKQNKNVIIDSPCNFQHIIERGMELAQKYSHDYKYVELKVNDMDLLDKRLQQRVPLRSQRTGVSRPPADAVDDRNYKDHQALFQKWMKEPCRPTEGVINVDSTLPPAEVLESLLNQMAISNDASSTRNT